MPNRLKPLNMMDFTGGINLRPETFQLRENELPELLNMEVDPRGGINTRKGWKGFGAAVPTSQRWDPRSAYAHTTSTGSRTWMFVNNTDTTFTAGRLWARVDTPTTEGTWTPVGSTISCAYPHLADYAAWGDLTFVVRGRGQQAMRWDVTGNTGTATGLPISASSNWQNDYTAPGSSDTFPSSELVAQQHGYMFAACTREDGVDYPNRLRFSHPNNPQRWAKNDYFDIADGGQKITAIMPFTDRLIIFKPDSVWALYGYDVETWELTNISRTVGCINQQCVARNEMAVFFLSFPQGVFGYSERGITELSVPIRTVFQDHRMTPSAMTNAWLGWTDRRLWVSLPFMEDVATPPTDACTVFVFDPTLSDPGSWTMFQGADLCVPAPYMERTDADQSMPMVAMSRQYKYLLQLDAITDSATDACRPDMPMPFPTRFRTRWIDAGAPTWKKSWRRPDFLIRALQFDASVNVQVFHDYDNLNAQRSFLVAFTPTSFPGQYTDDANPDEFGFEWGDGTLYGDMGPSSSVERGGTMGRAGAVQLWLVGEPGLTWGLNGIIFKYIPRRFR